MTREQRKLAAIVAADVVGYSRLMGRDESGTLARLRKNRSEHLDPALRKYGGRLVKQIGDGALVEFGSAVDALSAAIEFQQAMAEANRDWPADSALVFRVGVHLGDLIVDGDDLYGDGVNVAARLEAQAPAGGIVISRAVLEAVTSRVKATFEDLGNLALKNIERPVQAFNVKWAASDWRSPATSDMLAAPALPSAPLRLPDKPSIAVLPFENMSGDPEQEYFADGIAEDVLTTLSKIQELVVIARNSSFAFKGKSADIREVGRMLGVRYVLEGSVRKAGNRVRLTAQLIDSLDGRHLWADRFDGELNDVFDLQDRITQDIVAALEVRLTQGEQARVWRKRYGNPLAYESLLKGRSLYLNFARHTNAQAQEEIERALAVNPAFVPALYQLGFILADQGRFGWGKDSATAYEEALGCVARALAVDPGSGEAYMVIGYVRTLQRRYDEAIAAGEKAIALMPSGADAYHAAAMCHVWAGNFRAAAQYEEQAQRLSPLAKDESMVEEARSRYHLGDFTAARDIAVRVLQGKPRWLTAQSILVAALWKLGSVDEARTVAKQLLASHPSFSVGRWALRLPYRRQEDLDAMIMPLRLAGIPD